MVMRRVMVMAVLAACGSGGDAPVDSDLGPVADAPPDPHVTVAELVGSATRSVDILFVVDDSPGMGDKQLNVATAFPGFLSTLSALPDGLPDLHVGVITTDLGTKGTDSTAPGAAIGAIGNGGCAGTGKSGNLQTSGAAVTGTYVSDSRQNDGTRARNYTGTLASVFSQMVRVGSGGCGFAQPLAAARAGLGANPANAGFLRPDALLALIFLTDEDDCTFRTPMLLSPENPAMGPLQNFRCTRFGVTCTTGGTTSDQMNQAGTKSGCTATIGSTYMTDVAPFHAFLTGLKTDARKLVVASIAGAPTPFTVELQTPPGGGTPIPALASSCTYAGAGGPEAAGPPTRLATFVSSFTDANVLAPVCNRDLAPALTDVAQLIARKLGSPCLTKKLADQSPVQPGVQVECFVEDVDGAMATPIHACDPTHGPTCWRVMADPTTCPALDHLKLVVDRAASPGPATVTRMRCLVE